MPYKGYRKSDHIRRSIKVTTYVTEAEFVLMHEAAEIAGMTLSAFVRTAAMGSRPKAKPSRVRAKLIRQLAAIGNNLNQLARHANAGRLPEGESILHTLSHVMETIRRVKA